MKTFDTAVIGGGASGLMAAAQLCREGQDVLILESADRVGRKLLSTGAGRCNLSNTAVSTDNYRGGERLPDWFFQKYSPERIETAFRSLGLLVRKDHEGRIYPYSLRANTVLDILRKNTENAETVCSCEVIRTQKRNGVFLIDSADGKRFCAKKLILSCGGAASAQLSSGKNGYALAKSFGHTVTPLAPALCAVLVSQKDVRPLAGIRVRAKATLLEKEHEIAAESGEVQFTDHTLSGICIFNLSRFAKPGMRIRLDLMPEYTSAEVEALLPRGEEARRLFDGILHPRLALEALKKSSVPLSATGKEPLAADAVKNFWFEVTGLDSIRNAQVTAGGVPIREIDLSSMESELERGLYLTGEILDVDGICGGYNLHFAWSSALCAAEAILHSSPGGAFA